MLLDFFQGGAAQARSRKVSAPPCEPSGAHELGREASLRELLAAELDVLRAESSKTPPRSRSWIEDKDLHDRLIAVMKL